MTPASFIGALGGAVSSYAYLAPIYRPKQNEPRSSMIGQAKHHRPEPEASDAADCENSRNVPAPGFTQKDYRCQDDWAMSRS